MGVPAGGQALESAFEDYAAERELAQTLHANIRAVTKTCFTAADKRANRSAAAAPPAASAPSSALRGGAGRAPR